MARRPGGGGRRPRAAPSGGEGGEGKQGQAGAAARDRALIDCLRVAFARCDEFWVAERHWQSPEGNSACGRFWSRRRRRSGSWLRSLPRGVRETFGPVAPRLRRSALASCSNIRDHGRPAASASCSGRNAVAALRPDPHALRGVPIAKKRSPQTFEKRRREMDKQRTRAQKIADRIARKAEKREGKDDAPSGPRMFEVAEHPDRPEHPDNQDRPEDSG